MAELPRPVQTKSRPATIVFILAAAFLGAAVVDPLVESLANRGAFGPGDFTDHSTLDVIPALAIACFLALAVASGLAWGALRRRSYAPAWLRDCATAVGGRSQISLLPAIFVTQLAVLWSMETIEQLIVAGHPLGGTVWLGAPAPIGIAFHAAGCLAIVACLARFIGWSARTIVDVVAFVFRLVRALDAAPSALARATERVATRFLQPMLARLSGRAPPFPIA